MSFNPKSVHSFPFFILQNLVLTDVVQKHHSFLIPFLTILNIPNILILSCFFTKFNAVLKNNRVCQTLTTNRIASVKRSQIFSRQKLFYLSMKILSRHLFFIKNFLHPFVLLKKSRVILNI